MDHINNQTNSRTESAKSFWYGPRQRALIFQFLTFLIIGGFLAFISINLQQNLNSQGIASGFGFLSQEAGFEISETFLNYSAADSYLQALKVGFINTLKIGVVGNLLAIILGVIVGVLRLSPNWVISKIAQSYVEVVRNIPLLLQLFFLYTLITEVFPSVHEAWNPIHGLYISQRGLYYPIFQDHGIWSYVQLFFVLGLIGSFAVSQFLKKKREKTGKAISAWPISLALTLGLPFIVWLLGGAPHEILTPELGRFNFSGGESLSPEFAALLFGLVFYTGAFNAEIVRAGILSVDKGQWEASEALGLSRVQALRFIILPQSLRVIIPPMTSQVLNLIKNSSLAVAIGYPDFVAVANTTLNQTGQAIECVLLIMSVYLFFSLLSSFVMNLHHKRMALKEN